MSENFHIRQLASHLRLGDTYSSDAYLLRLAKNIVSDFGQGLEKTLKEGELQTIYIAPTVSEAGTRCRVYALPYPMKEGQSPQHIAEKYRAQWKEIALLADNNSTVVYIDPDYKDIAPDLMTNMAGTHWTHIHSVALQRHAQAHEQASTRERKQTVMTPN